MRKLWLGLLLLGLIACDNDAPNDTQTSPATTTSPAPGVTEAIDEQSTNEPVVVKKSSATDAPVAAKRAPELVRPTLAQAKQAVPLGLLPSGVIPLRYALELTVFPGQKRFAGHVDIAVKLEQATDQLFFHGKGLDVSSAEVLLPSGKRLNATYSEIHEDGIATLEFEQVIEAGNLIVEIDYTAAFGRLLHGLYKVTADGNDYAFTQMESVFAREAFPSFDEPAFKTPFELTLVVNEKHVAIANMTQVDEQLFGEGLKRVRFAPSPPMTTYLFAIAVGPFDVVDNGAIAPNAVRSEPLPFRGLAIRGKGGELAYAMKETGSILEALENYFDSPYPYSKLDIIAVPDFEAGAMENIGAITFREKLLLLNDDSSPQQKRAYASVMAHELAHMWFGNLVTMPWWNDIWLNESFSTWMSYKAVEAYDPAQKPKIALLKRSVAAMQADALVSARQIREPVVDNDGIAAAFDGITYSKGGAVLNMFEQYIGEDLFRKGVRAHMRKFAHANATVHDLIDSLSSASGQDLQPAADTFLFQNGVPLVEAALDCQRNTVELNQSRYLPLGSKGDPQREWIVPLCLKMGRGSDVFEECVMIGESEQSVKFEGSCPDWVLPNANFAGYFHWLLPASQYSALLGSKDQLNEQEWLSVADSAQAGFASGRLDVAATWGVIEQLATSPYPSVGRSMLSTVSFMEETLGDNPKLRWTIRGRGAALYKHLEAHRAFDADFLKSLPDNETRIYYSDVASFMAETAYDQTTRSMALEKARAFLGDEKSANSVSNATLDTILTVGVQDGGQALVEALHQRFLDSDDAWFRDTALSALARSRDPEFGQKLRDSTLAGTLRSNEIVRLFYAQLEEDVNVVSVWEWLKVNIDELIPLMPAAHVPRLTRVAERLCDQQFSTELDEVLRPRLKSLPGGEHRLNNSLERLNVCAESAKIQRPQARAFFSQDGPRR